MSGTTVHFRPVHMCRAFEEHLAQVTSEAGDIQIRIGRA